MTTALEKQSDLYAQINKYPAQFEVGFRMAEHIRLPKEVHKVIISAYGIPAATAQIVLDMFADKISNTKEALITTSYDLPGQINKNTLVIAIDLERGHPAILSTLKTAYENRANIVGITTGGETEIYLRERGLGLILIDEKLEFLYSQVHTGLLIGIITQLLISTRFLIPKIKFLLLSLAEELEKLYLPKLGERFANQIEDSTVLLYTESGFVGLTQLVKAHLNIVLNIPVFYQIIPQALGDELIGFGRKNFAKYKALFPQDILTDSRHIKDIEIAKRLLDQSKINYYNWELPGKTRPLSILSGIILLYWATYWLKEKNK